MSALFTEDAEEVLMRAKHIALEFAHEYVGSEHLLTALCESGPAHLRTLFAECGVTSSALKSFLANNGNERSIAVDTLHFSPRAKEVFCRALNYPVTSPRVTSEALLASILDAAICKGRRDGAAEALAHIGVSIAELHEQFCAKFSQ